MPEGSRPAHQPRHPGSSRRRGRTVPKGRQVFPSALDEIRALLGDAPRRRDLLIEHLHLIQDATAASPPRHLAALAEEMGLAQAEVYEVATFYAHFDVVKEGEAAPAAGHRPRLREPVLHAGRRREADRRPRRRPTGSDVRVVRAPCMGRCDAAPVAEVGHYYVDNADCRRRCTQAIAEHRHDPVDPATTRTSTPIAPTAATGCCERLRRAS